MVTFAKALALIGEAEWDDRHRSGRLDEGDAVERGLATGRYFKVGLRSLLLPAPRGRSGLPPRVEPLHIRVSSVSKRPPSGSGGLSPKETEARRGRVYVKAKRGRVRDLQAAGGAYDRKARSWYVPEAQFAAAARALGPAIQRKSGGAARTSRGRVRAGAAASFQRYVERADLPHDERVAELMADGDGVLISFGTIGDDADERAAFWDAVEARERVDGCVQNRAIIALPHELDGDELAALARDLMRPLAERGLPHHAAVHRPDIEAGSDPRNIHLHALWSERPAERAASHAWTFAARKDRTARGPSWVRELRERSAATINRHLDAADERRRKDGRPLVGRRFDARSYAERGEATLPGVHLGPGRSALERAGVPTAAGVVNALRAAVNERVETASRANERRGRAAILSGSPGVPAEAAERLVRALDRLDEIERRPDPALRARRRAAWASAAATLADGRQELAASAFSEASRLLGLLGDDARAPDAAEAAAAVRTAGWAAARAAADHARRRVEAHHNERAADADALRAGRMSPTEAIAREGERRADEREAARGRVMLLEMMEPDADTARRRRARRDLDRAEERCAVVARISGPAPLEPAAVLRVLGATPAGPDAMPEPVRRRRSREVER